VRSRRERGRSLRLAVGVVLAGATLSAGVALAASQTITTTGGDAFTAASFTTDQGEGARFQNNGGTHNVTATATGPDGKALFRSQTISGGTAPVSGTQYLTTGSYDFICTIHPSTMQAKLQVTGNGTPVPRPSATLAVKAKTVEKVVAKGRLLVAIDTSTKIDGVNLAIRLGKTVIARANSLALAAGKQFAVVKLSKAGRSKLEDRAKATVVATAEIPFAAPASIRKKLS
jgi:plastocyanin